MNVRQNDIITAFCKTTAELTLGCVNDQQILSWLRPQIVLLLFYNITVQHPANQLSSAI